MSKATKIYPVRGRWLPGIPVATQVVATKGQADELIASGAFTDNPNDADRDHDAPDISETQGEPFEHEQTWLAGERETVVEAPVAEPQPEPEATAPEPSPADPPA